MQIDVGSLCSEESHVVLLFRSWFFINGPSSRQTRQVFYTLLQAIGMKILGLRRVGASIGMAL
jgi:hypothetical protein